VQFAQAGVAHDLGAALQLPQQVRAPLAQVDDRQTRFQWGLGVAGAEPVIVGFDVAVIDEDGRITTVLGFLDKVPG
jgi:hypothetical protein